MSSVSPQDTEELCVEFTHEELFQFYSQVRTNEKRLSVHMCVVLCKYAFMYAIGWRTGCSNVKGQLSA